MVNFFLSSFPATARGVDPTQAVNLVASAEFWNRFGGGQASLARYLFDWTGVKLLATSWEIYRDVILVGLSL